MAGLMTRIRRLVLAEAHQQVDTMEDPSAMATQILRDLTVELQQARHALVIALGTEKQLRRQAQDATAEAGEWQQRAERWLQAGDETRARQALERTLQLEAKAQALSRPLEAAQRARLHRGEQVERLQQELQKVRQRVALIKANQTAAGLLRDVSGGDPYTRACERQDQLDRYAERASGVAAEAEAASELLNEEDRLARESTDLDLQQDVAARLATLKAKLQGGPAAAKTGSAQ